MLLENLNDYLCKLRDPAKGKQLQNGKTQRPMTQELLQKGTNRQGSSGPGNHKEVRFMIEAGQSPLKVNRIT